MTESFLLFIHDQLSELGPIHIRKMFGGAGVYMDGVMFALTANDQLFLKANTQTKVEFESAGMSPFIYKKKSGKRFTMSYYGVSEELLEDRDSLLQWAKKAIHSAIETKQKIKPTVSIKKEVKHVQKNCKATPTYSYNI